MRRHHHGQPPIRRPWVGVAQNVLLAVAALITLYLVYLAMTR
jgi:hypothetical protein